MGRLIFAAAWDWPRFDIHAAGAGRIPVSSAWESDRTARRRDDAGWHRYRNCT